MRKTTRSAAAAVAAAIMLAALVGCKVGAHDDESLFAPPEYVYVAETLPLPSGIGAVQHLAVADGKLYFATSSNEFDEETMMYSNSAALYSMNIDGTGLTHLESYAAPMEVPNNVSGSVDITALIIDGDGNLWVAERWEFFGYDFPEGHDAQSDEPWDYYVSLDSGNTIRKLSATGAEMLSVDLSSLSGEQEFFRVNTFNVDGSGNIYLAVDSWERGGRTIHVLDSLGIWQFDLSTNSLWSELIRMPDGSIAFTEESIGATGFARALRTIDFASKSLSDNAIDLPGNAWQIYPGSGEFDIIFSENDTVYGLTVGADEPVKLLSWMESDIINTNIENITMMPDGRILCSQNTLDRVTFDMSCDVYLLTRTPYSELPSKTIVTLAALYMQQDLRDAIVKFNRTSLDTRIQVIDYSQFGSDGGLDAGLTRLTSEISSGNAPDILSVSNLPYREYAEKGLLADLYPFIDSDPELSRDDFVQGPFNAAEIGGGLYQAFSEFRINTIVGHPSVVGPGTGWSMDEFKAVLDAHPEADMPLGRWLTKTSFLQASIAFDIGRYIDWEEGTANFDTPQFVQLLESADNFPSDIDWEGSAPSMGGMQATRRIAVEGGGGRSGAAGRAGGGPGTYVAIANISEDEAVSTGRQIMAQLSLGDFFFYKYYTALFGGQLAFKGFPSEGRDGNSFNVSNGLAIAADSEHKEAAWAFVRTILDDDWQRSNVWVRGFPTNKAAFDSAVAEALSMEPGTRGINGIDIDPPTQADIDAITTLISTASGTAGWDVDQTLWGIISEGASDYFDGVSSAQDVAKVIQSRVSILVSERS